MKIQNTPTLADSVCDLRARKIKRTFFSQINALIDWDKISNIMSVSTTGPKNTENRISFSRPSITIGFSISGSGKKVVIAPSNIKTPNKIRTNLYALILSK